MNEERIQKELDDGVKSGVFPGCALEVSFNGERVVSLRSGFCSIDQGDRRITRDTIFDLGSLTKPLATTSALMMLSEQLNLDLDKPLHEILGETFPNDKRSMTPRNLLCHASGLPDWRPFYRELRSVEMSKRKKHVRRMILKEPLTYSPESDCVYSDLGFILLEWVVESLSGYAMGDFVEKKILRPLGLLRTFIFRRERTTGYKREEFAATEACPWRGRVLQGEVHDENAFALGGYSGHAGLFGTAGDILTMAMLFRDHLLEKRNDLFRPDTVRRFFKRQEHIPACNRALGWDMPSKEKSAAGKYLSSNSVGHLGFPGTSLWMDLEKDIQIVFLSNRIHPSRENTAIREFRPYIHDVVMEVIGAAKR
jgi:CubicO group peptidase (beta-lactamase class C family)